jgi:hypothetical protein
MPFNLTPEEAYLWHCACTWRNPTPPPDPQNLDWHKVVTTGRTNRMAILLDGILQTTNLIHHLPPAAVATLQEWTGKLNQKAADFTRVLHQYMPLAAQQNLETMPMKGLWVAANLYGNPAMRPGHDMDILVRRGRIRDCVAILERLGFGRYWRQTLADEFYERHHLHLELSPPDCWTWVEIHWAYDHPRTLLTIDYEAVLDRTTPGQLLGVPVRDPSPPDLLLYLSIHLVKHAVYLPATLHRPDLPRIILADGRLMYFLDVAEAIRHYGDQLDWQQTIQLAHEFGAVNILGSVLQVCRDWLDAPVPPAVLDQLPITPPGRITNRLMNEVASHKVAEYLGQPTSPFWRFMVAENYTFVFRPIRLLDLLAYTLPGRDYLQRRYGRATLPTALSHLLRTTAQYGRLALDTLYYTLQNKRRPIPTFTTLPPTLLDKAAL